MSTVDIPHSPAMNRHDQQPGTWRRVEKDDECWIIVVKCPECGRISTLCKSPHFPGKSHRIDESGAVDPSIVCPFSGCTWHVWGRLLEWGERQN